MHWELAVESWGLWSEAVGLRFSQEREEWHADSRKSKRNSTNHEVTRGHLISPVTMRSSVEREVLGGEGKEALATKSCVNIL